MTREEFINLAKQSTDRPDLLTKMGYPYSIENVQQYIRDQRWALGISVDEMFDCFLAPTITKEHYVECIVNSKTKREALKNMGKQNTQENMMKYITDVGRKYGFTFEEIENFFQK